MIILHASRKFGTLPRRIVEGFAQLAAERDVDVVRISMRFICFSLVREHRAWTKGETAMQA